MSITREHRQESLAIAYIHAVAGACGLTWSHRNLDYGADVTLHQVRVVGKALLEWSFQLDIQVKSTRRVFQRRGDLHYDLEVRNYHWLRDASAFYPRVLCLLVLPPDESRWLSVSERQLILRGSMYWASLKSMPTTANQRTCRVRLSQRNRFSPHSVQQIMRQFEGSNVS